MFRFAQFSTVVLLTVSFFSFNTVEARQSETGSPDSPPVDRLALWDDALGLNAPTPEQPQEKTAEEPMRPIDRIALLGDEYVTATEWPSTTKTSEPIPFSVSTMANDVVPPFASVPALTPAKKEVVEVSFEENMPIEKGQPGKTDSIDDCCRDLTEMIAGNLGSEISLDAKKRMIETALKMVARNVALKAEAKITKLKADHALEMARMHSQMGHMRSTSSAADQINRVAGPLSQMLQKNYQQAIAMEIGNQKLTQMLAQLGYQQLEEESRVARSNRQRIQLKTTQESASRQENDEQWRIAQLTQQLDRLQRQLADHRNQPQTNQNVRRATYNQPLQPRRQPLEPLQRFQTNEYQYQQTPQWQR